MEVVVDKSIYPETAALNRMHQFCILRLILRNDDRLSPPRRFPHAFANLRHDIVRRRVEDLLCRVQPKSVNVKLLDPVCCVSDEEFAYWTCVFTIEVDGLTPIVLVFAGEIVG